MLVGVLKCDAQDVLNDAHRLALIAALLVHEILSTVVAALESFSSPDQRIRWRHSSSGRSCPADRAWLAQSLLFVSRHPPRRRPGARPLDKAPSGCRGQL